MTILYFILSLFFNFVLILILFLFILLQRNIHNFLTISCLKLTELIMPQAFLYTSTKLGLPVQLPTKSRLVSSGHQTTKRMFRMISKLKVLLALTILLCILFITGPLRYHQFLGRFLLQDQTNLKFVNLATLEKGTPTKNYSISLFVRTPATVQRFKERLYCVLLRTTVLFWPASYGKIVVVFDDESSEDHQFGEQLKKQFMQNFSHHQLDVLYEPLPKDPTIIDFTGPKFWQRAGYNRQLWSSFFIDLYTNDSIIAWMDTDSAFLTPVTKPTIFNGTRVRILGSECTMNFGWVKDHDTAGINERLLGLPMVADFMMYFPVYIYRDTFTNTRNYILKRFKTDNFEDAFRKVYNKDTGLISPVSVVISYAWFYEHDRYDWSIEMCTDLETYNKRFSDARFRIRPQHVKSLFSQPHTALHSSPMEKFSIFSPIIPISYCLAKRKSRRKTGHVLEVFV